MKFLLVVFAMSALAVAQELDSDGLHSRDTIELDEASVNPENDPTYWDAVASQKLQNQIKITPITNTAKNVIMFLGDGMSIPTLTAARFYGAELENVRVGEEEFLSFEQFPYVGLSRTYCVDSQVADSACSATAYLGGVKGNKGTIGVTGSVKRKDCAASLDSSNHVESIAVAAQKAGLSLLMPSVGADLEASKVMGTFLGKFTGIVTNTRITHASPAGNYAHVADRDWESDYEIQKDGRNSSECEDIARQLIMRKPGKEFNVIMGGGRRSFIPKIEVDPIEKVKGYRLDNVNLINEWKRDKISRKKSYAYVTTRDELKGMVEAPTYLLGLFAHDHMDDEIVENKLQPTLEEMTEAAINLLQKNKKGYFLFVEGGRIDMAHHGNKAQISLHETLAFSRAIAKAVDMTNENDTLIVVTADHAHTMSFSGYAKRTESIFGFGGMGKDKLPYAVLSYSNGPGFSFDEHGRKDLRKDDTKAADYVFPAGAPLGSETHGGDDVGVFARGPFAHIFSGSFEQNYIPHAMAYAANLTLRADIKK